jgi:hypothetical protein
MKETPKKRITVTSSLNEISTGQLGKLGGGEMSLPAHFTAGFWTNTYLKTTLTAFPPPCFMLLANHI